MRFRLLLVLVFLSLLIVPTHARPGFESYLLGKTMPVSTESNIVVRSMIEEMFVKYLNKNKIDAIEANKVILTDRSYSDEEIKEHVLNNGIKSVLIIKFIGTTETTTQLPSTITGTGNIFYLNPGATITHQILMFELTLYDAELGQMIWTANAKVTCGALTKLHHVFDSLADKTVKQLIKNGHIKSEP